MNYCSANKEGCQEMIRVRFEVGDIPLLILFLKNSMYVTKMLMPILCDHYADNSPHRHWNKSNVSGNKHPMALRHLFSGV